MKGVTTAHPTRPMSQVHKLTNWLHTEDETIAAFKAVLSNLSKIKQDAIANMIRQVGLGTASASKSALQILALAPLQSGGRELDGWVLCVRHPDLQQPLCYGSSSQCKPVHSDTPVM